VYIHGRILNPVDLDLEIIAWVCLPFAVLYFPPHLIANQLTS
jgi:hypothetical protein